MKIIEPLAELIDDVNDADFEVDDDDDTDDDAVIRRVKLDVANTILTALTRALHKTAP